MECVALFSPPNAPRSGHSFSGAILHNLARKAHTDPHLENFEWSYICRCIYQLFGSLAFRDFDSRPNETKRKASLRRKNMHTF